MGVGGLGTWGAVGLFFAEPDGGPLTSLEREAALGEPPGPPVQEPLFLPGRGVSGRMQAGSGVTADTLVQNLSLRPCSFSSYGSSAGHVGILWAGRVNGGRDYTPWDRAGA